MKPHLAIIFALLVVTPLALLAWLGVREGEAEARRVEDRFREVFAGHLADIESGIGRTVGDVERELYAVTERAGGSAEDMRAIVRGSRFVRQVFIRDALGHFSFPPADPSQRTEAEAEFYDRTRSVWESGVEFGAGGANWQADDVAQAVQQLSYGQVDFQQPLGGAALQAQQTERGGGPAGNNDYQQRSLVEPADPATGWYGWFWGDGLNWLYWRQPYPGGAVVGAEVDRMAFVAEIVGALPTDTGVAGGRVVLADARARPIYQWGRFDPDEGAAPDAERALGLPLAGWRLAYFAEPAGAPGSGGRVGLIAGLAAVGIALLGLALYFWREHSRELREAEQKVSFVNQVSHELKTPLTNIRMYAELAAEKIDPESADPALDRCLGVVTEESGRLSRLIGNVLTLAKRGKSAPVRPTQTDIDAAVAATVDLFRPSLERAGVEIEVRGRAGEGEVDRDALEQILGNLLSNVEKYAACGGRVRVEVGRSGDRLSVAVEDAGPGVPRPQRERIFRPFTRLEDAVTEGASGTGIGLGIARDLARAHGGDLKLEPARKAEGCRFVATLRC